VLGTDKIQMRKFVFVEKYIVCIISIFRGTKEQGGTKGQAPCPRETMTGGEFIRLSTCFLFCNRIL
jgi:hypothetical protein